MAIRLVRYRQGPVVAISGRMYSEFSILSSLKEGVIRNNNTEVQLGTGDYWLGLL